MMSSTLKNQAAQNLVGANDNADDMEAYAKRHLGWNFGVNTVDAAFFFFASSFASTQVVLPVFVDKLTNSPFLVGLVGAVYNIGFFLPQLFFAGHAERLDRQKPMGIWLGIGIRLPILLMALACFWFSGGWLTALFFVCFGLFSLSLGATMPYYMNLIAKVFPVQTRGIFTGFSNALGNGLGVLGGVIVGLLLQNGEFPANFGIIYLISFGLFAVSLLGFALNREPVQTKSVTETSSYSLKDYFRQLPAIVRRDKNYRNFVIARASFVAVSACGGLLAAYSVVRFNLDESVAGGFTVAFMIANSAASFLGGIIGDRYGHKLSLVGACGAMLAGLVLALVAPGEGWLYVSYGLYGAFVGAYLVSYQVIVLEFAPDDQRSTYIGLTNTLMAPISLLAPLLAGGLAEWLGYPLVLGILVVLIAYSIFMLLAKVRDPRYNKENLKQE
jgi:MFS family permease